MKSFLSSSMGCALIRFGWMGATRRPTPIAIRTRNDACRTDFDDLVAAAAAWRLPRTQSWHGMALRGGARDAGAKGKRSREIARPHCDRARAGHWKRGAGSG